MTAYKIFLCWNNNYLFVIKKQKKGINLNVFMLRFISPKNLNSVIIFSPSCCYKPMWFSFIFLNTNWDLRIKNWETFLSLIWKSILQKLSIFIKFTVHIVVIHMNRAVYLLKRHNCFICWTDLSEALFTDNNWSTQKHWARQ